MAAKERAVCCPHFEHFLPDQKHPEFPPSISSFEFARRNRICGDGCIHRRDAIIRRSGVYFCARCPAGKFADAAASHAGDHLEVVFNLGGDHV